MAVRVEAPDYAAPFVAWRAWVVAPASDPDTAVLRSVVKRTVWEPGRVATARCLRPRWLRWGQPHAAPDPACECGIYAGDVRLAGRYFRDPFFAGGTGRIARVVGRVALWGDVIDCERGFRASHAYPLELHVPGRTSAGAERVGALELAARLEVYGVPVDVVDADEETLLRKLSSPARTRRGVA